MFRKINKRIFVCESRLYAVLAGIEYELTTPRYHIKFTKNDLESEFISPEEFLDRLEWVAEVLEPDYFYCRAYVFGWLFFAAGVLSVLLAQSLWG